MIAFTHVTKKYGRHIALYDVCLEIAAGQHIIVVGMNGAGKTTFLRLLLGLDEPSEGAVTWSHRKPSRIGYVPEKSILPGRATVRELVALWAGDQAEHLLETLFLRDFADQRVDSLSKGERQRAALALAIAAGEKLIVLDEPYEGLDPLTRPLVRSTVNRTLASNSNVTCVATTHRVEEITSPMDRVIAFNAGRVVRDLTFAELQKEVAASLRIVEERDDVSAAIECLRRAGASAAARCVVEGRSAVVASGADSSCSVGTVIPATIELLVQLWIAPNLLRYTVS